MCRDGDCVDTNHWCVIFQRCIRYQQAYNIIHYFHLSQRSLLICIRLSIKLTGQLFESIYLSDGQVLTPRFLVYDPPGIKYL